MTVNFPDSPSTNDLYTFSNKTWKYNGSGWASVSDGIPATLVDAAGDLIVGSAADTVGRLALGTNGYVLTVDTAGSGVDKIKWAAPAAADINPLFLAGV